MSNAGQGRRGDERGGPDLNGKLTYESLPIFGRFGARFPI